MCLCSGHSKKSKLSPLKIGMVIQSDWTECLSVKFNVRQLVLPVPPCVFITECQNCITAVFTSVSAATGLVLELVITQGRARNLAAAAAAQPGAAAVSLGVFSPRQDFRAGGRGNVDINSAEAADLSS